MCRWSFKWVEEIIFVDENDGQTSLIWFPGWGDPHAPKAGQWGRLSGFPGVTGWSISKNTKINTTVRAFQTKHISDPACPIVRALRSAHFAICINTTRVVITVITALLLQGRNMAVIAFQITGPSTGSGNGLVPNRRQAITWTNEISTLSYWRHNHW